MSRSAWQPLNQVNLSKVEEDSFIVVARPDGKSWAGLMKEWNMSGVVIANANTRTDLHFALNPTASFQVLTKPKWELGFGQPRLDL